ncbi:MAG: hypothetical protein E6Q83_03745 [Thiothrix sp.]|nr:MAG: hypothetical protein E6Q83_03745 [Thiothrix sp.]
MSLNNVLDKSLPYGVRLSLYIGAWLLAIVMGIAGVSTYYSSNPSPIGFIKAIFLFAGFLLILHGASGILFDSSKPVSWRAIALVVAISMLAVDTFTISHEQQTGIMEKIKTSQQAVTDSSTKAQHLAGLRKELAACPENHYTKCKQPLLAAIQQAETSTGGTAFNANAAGEEAYWVALAEWFNKDRLPEDKIDAGQVALYVYAFLGFLGSVFIILGFGFYGATTSDQQHSPTPLPPTGTDDTTHKGSDYRTSKVGFNSPAPVPAANSKGTVSNSSANTKYSSRTVYPAQNTVRVERSATSASVPRATSIAPAVTMGSPSSAQAKAAQRWHLTDGNAALDTSTVLETPTVLTPSTVPEQFNLSKNTAEGDRNTEKYSSFYAAYDEALRTGVVGRATVRPTKQWLAEQLKQSEVQLNTVERDNCVNWLLAEAERRGRIRPVFGRDDKHPQGRCEVVK